MKVINKMKLYFNHNSMLRNILKNKCFGFSQKLESLYQLQLRIRDVTKIRGLKKKDPYFLIQNVKVQLNLESSIGTVRTSDKSETSQLRFYDSHLNIYHNSTPVLRVLSESFFVKYLEEYYYVFTNQSLIEPAESPCFEKADASGYLQQIVRESLRELDHSESISGISIHNMLTKIVLENAEEFKIEKIRYKELMKVIDKRIDYFNEQIKIIDNELKAKAIRKVRYFVNFVYAQVAIIQYYVYFNLSWDIMEPITCILANIDLLVAYLFFLNNGGEFSLESYKNHTIESNKNQYLAKYGIDVQKYNELLEIKDYVNLRLGLLSKNPHVLMNTIEQPFKMLDLR